MRREDFEASLHRFDRRKGFKVSTARPRLHCCAHNGRVCAGLRLCDRRRTKRVRKRRWPDEPAIASLHLSSRDITVTALRACRRFPLTYQFMLRI